MINHENNKSIDFSLHQENDIQDLLENISSSYSANVSCSFENDIDIDITEYTNNQLNKRKCLRNVVPQHVKNLARDFCSNLFSNYKSSEGYKTIFSKDKENVSLRDSNFNTNYTNFLKSPSRGSISDIQSAELKYNLNVKPITIKKFPEEVNMSQESDKFLVTKKTPKRVKIKENKSPLILIKEQKQRLNSAMVTDIKSIFPLIVRDKAKDVTLNCSVLIETNNKTDQSLPLIETRPNLF